MICISTSGPGSPSLGGQAGDGDLLVRGVRAEDIAAQGAIGPADKVEGEGRAAAGVSGRTVKGEGFRSKIKVS